MTFLADDIVLDSLMSGNENDKSLEDPPDEMRKDRIEVRTLMDRIVQDTNGKGWGKDTKGLRMKEDGRKSERSVSSRSRLSSRQGKIGYFLAVGGQLSNMVSNMLLLLWD